jgi:hypothetical protein
MTTLISDVLDAILNHIASYTYADVTLGTPVESETGLYIFTYQFSEDSLQRVPPNKGTKAKQAHSYQVSCLLMSNPAYDYTALDEGLKCLTERPVLTLHDTKVTATLTSLSIETLTQIFISAGITLRLAIPFELKWAEV